MRALLGTASHFCEEVVIKLRTPSSWLIITLIFWPTEPVYYTAEGGGADSYPPDKPGDCSPNCYMQTPERCFAAQSTRHSETLLCCWS